MLTITTRKERLRRYFTAAVSIVYINILAMPVPRLIAQEIPPTNTTPQEPVPDNPVPQPAPEPEPTPTPAPSNPTPGPQKPPGPDASTYIWNSEKKVWENDQYSWDPVTKKTSPKTPVSFSYNPETKRWDTTEWVYSPEQGKYIAQPTSVPSNTATAGQSPASSDVAPQSSKTGTNAQAAVPEKLSIVPPPTTQPSLSVSTSSDDSYYDLYFNASISTTHSSHAISGDASILQNTNGGSAATGNALAMANILNMVQSVWGWQGFTPNFYTADIQGDHYGDILINPGALNFASSDCNCGDLTVVSSTDASIENNIDLYAKSGDATVAGNTNAGDATTGSATAIANIINMINSSIASGQSFIGTLNIHGSLEGDILLPENLIDELIAANIPSTQMEIGGNTNINLEDTTNISNDITATAVSGNANVSGNTNAGSATSGNADTEVTVFNLTGRNLIGANALLVFVNVAGEWVGFITDAPNGATSAMLGGGITTNEACGNCGQNMNIDASSESKISNNVNVTAVSGDANVTGNTNGGNASTGDASAQANIANITTSNFSLSGWFGILFINILNDWLGSFNTDTEYGNKPKVATLPPSNPTTTPTITMLPTYSGGDDDNGSTSSSAVPSGNRNIVRAYQVNFEDDGDGNAVLASATETTPPTDPQDEVKSDTVASLNSSNLSNLLILTAVVVSFVVIFHGDWLKSAVLRSRGA